MTSSPARSSRAEDSSYYAHLEQQLRFAVRRPGIPEASPRSHGVPRRDVPGRVHVSVADETAGSAPEDGLALTRLPVHVPACRAPLAGQRRSDLLYPALSLILQAAHQHPPARGQDAPVQPSLGSDVPARVPGRSPGRAGHVLDLQVLDPDHVEPARQVRACLFRPVLAPVGLAGVQPGNRVLHPSAALRARLSASELALQPPQTLALPRGQARHVQQLTGRQGSRHRHAPVNADHLAAARRRDRIGNGGEGDMPAPGPVHCHPVRLHARRNGAGPAESHPPDLRHPHLADVAGDATHVPLLPASPHDAETLVPASLAPRRSTGRVLRVEERGHRLVEVPQRLLLHHLGACGQPRVLCPGLGELSALLQVAGRALAAWLPVLVLLDSEVPHIPGVRAVVPQHRQLCGCGEQPVSGHANILSTTTDISGEVKRRFLSGLKARVSTPRSR